jgi:molybdopterin-synthase adenylyltransferase
MVSASPPTALQRPNVKPVFQVLYLNGRVRLGGGLGYASEIDDPDGTYARLVRLLDGTHDVDEIVAAMAPELDAVAVAQAVTTLVDAGYVEDAAAVPPPSLTAPQLERYRPNMNFFSTLPGPRDKYEHQLTLRDARGLLLGLGGIGSNVCVALAELGVGRLLGVDFDAVELSNLNRQVLYSTNAVGRAKVDVAAEYLRAFNPEVRFTGVRQRIASVDDVRELMAAEPWDFVVNLADKPNGFIDHWVNQAAVEHGCPLFAAAIYCGVGTAYSVVPRCTACYACRVERELLEAPHLREELEYARTFEVNDANGALGLACMFQAYVVTSEVLRHLLGIAPLVTANATLEIDFLSFEQTLHPFPRDPECAVCGNGAPRHR